MIRLSGLTKKYGDFTAVDSIDLHVPSGELFGFVGPNGAGKTTTLRMIAGHPQADGRDGADRRDRHRDATRSPAKAKLGFIPDRPFIYEKLTGAEFLRFVAGLYGEQGPEVEHRARELMALFDLEEWRDELVESYSHGMRQKLIISSAFVHRPQVIVVDEPHVGLDPQVGQDPARPVQGVHPARPHDPDEHAHARRGRGAVRPDRDHRGREDRGVRHDERAARGRRSEGGLEEIFLRLTGERAARDLVDVLDA